MCCDRLGRGTASFCTAAAGVTCGLWAGNMSGGQMACSHADTPRVHSKRCGLLAASGMQAWRLLLLCRRSFRREKQGRMVSHLNLVPAFLQVSGTLQVSEWFWWRVIAGVLQLWAQGELGSGPAQRESTAHQWPV